MDDTDFFCSNFANLIATFIYSWFVLQAHMKIIIFFANTCLLSVIREFADSVSVVDPMITKELQSVFTLQSLKN